MNTNASKRRDNVALFKKILNYVMVVCMAALSAYMSYRLVWLQYYNSLSFAKQATANWDACLKYIDDNKLLIISYVICCCLAFGFLVFLIFKGIQALVVKFMMRKANIG